MAGTVTIEIAKHNSVKRAVVTWLSDGDGDADATTVELDGEIIKVTTNPGAAAPTDNYDITLVDVDGVDIAEGLLANRDTANNEEVYLYKELTLTDTANFAVPVFHSGVVTPTVANAGASKNGVMTIYYR